MMRSEMPKSQITQASAAFVDHTRPSSCSAASPKTPPVVRHQSVRRMSPIAPAQRLRLGRSLPFQSELDAIGDLQSIIGDLRRRNKRLKRRLQRYEDEPVPLPERTLFEVNTSGLNVRQRYDLLEILLGFADGLSPEEPGLAIYTKESLCPDEQQDGVNHFTISPAS